MDEEDFVKLVKLNPEDFDHREWVALAWVRDWTLFEGKTPDEELNAEFEKLYSEQERRDILAVATVMNFANRFNNTISKKTLVPPTETSKAKFTEPRKASRKSSAGQEESP